MLSEDSRWADGAVALWGSGCDDGPVDDVLFAFSLMLGLRGIDCG